jgi:hypothetical protein
MGTLIGKVKKLKREGLFPEELFTEIKLDSIDRVNPTAPIEIHWEKGEVISFTRWKMTASTMEQILTILN